MSWANDRLNLSILIACVSVLYAYLVLTLLPVWPMHYFWQCSEYTYKDNWALVLGVFCTPSWQSYI